MSYEDLQRDLRGCVMIHKNKPVYVSNISRDGMVKFTELITQKEGVAPFTLASFASPTRRLGFVNVMGSVVYVSRTPVRKFFLGLNRGNVAVKVVAGVEYPEGQVQTAAQVSRLCSTELGNAMFNKYPTFAECVKHLQMFKPGAMAFDKQFALTSEGRVLYKEKVVGTYKKNAKTVEDIQWESGKEYLSILLKGNYEKAARDFKSSSQG